MSALSREELELLINGKLNSTQTHLQETDWLILTLGTTFNFRHLASGLEVANCHKLPGAEFERKRLTVEEMLVDFDAMLAILNGINSNLNIIITVSPVRHIKDTLSGNNLSKSTLRYFAQLLTEKYSNVVYFPSYEILIDDLRDYRFYKEDLIHPTDQAIQYIWSHFTQSVFSKESARFLEKWSKLSRALSHKPFHSYSEQHQKFLRDIHDQLSALSESIDVSSELEEVEKQLL